MSPNGWAAYLDADKTNTALYPFGVGNTENDAIASLENAIVVMDDVAEANGYVRLEPGQVVVSRDAIKRAAKIIEYDVCGRPGCKCGELAAELRAALEANDERD